MPELRRSSLKQLKKLNADIKRQGGDIGNKRDKSEDKFNNVIYIHNPVEEHTKGKRRISTYEDHAKIDIPDAPHLEGKINFFDKKGTWFSSGSNLTSIKDHQDRFGNAISFSVEGIDKTFKTESEYQNFIKSGMNKFPTPEDNKKKQEEAKQRVAAKRQQNITPKNNENTMITVKKLENFQPINENGNNDTPQEIMSNMKTIANCHPYTKVPNPTRERGILTPGKYIEVGDIKGYISRIEGGLVYIEEVWGGFYSPNKGRGAGKTSTKSVTLKDVVKAYKKEKEKEPVKGDLSMIGPANANVGTAPKEQSGNVGAKIDAKATDAPDQKLSNKIYTIGDFKKLDNSSLTPNFDNDKMIKGSTTLKPVVAKDQKITNANIIVKKIGEYDSNLAKEPAECKAVKGKHNTIASEIIGNAVQKAEQDITKKNNKVKMFGEYDQDLSQKFDLKAIKTINKPIATPVNDDAKKEVETKITNKNFVVKKLKL